MKRRLILAILTALALIGSACAPTAAPPVPTRPAGSPLPTEPVQSPLPTEPAHSPLPTDLAQPDASGLIHGKATVESITLLTLETFPVQIRVVVRGTLADGCTGLGEARQSIVGNTIHLDITTTRPADKMCIQIVAPFEQTYPLDVFGLPAGSYTVDANGVTDSFTFDVDNVPALEPIGWTEAEKLILDGQVQQIFQAHSLEVQMTLKDGRRVVATEPSIDEVFQVVDRCGQPCAGIALATE